MLAQNSKSFRSLRVFLFSRVQFSISSTLRQVAENPPLEEQITPLEVPMSLFALTQSAIYVRQYDRGYGVVLCRSLILVPLEQRLDECYDSGVDAQAWSVREDHCSQQGYGKRQQAELVPLLVGNSKFPIIRGIETRVSKSDVQVPEHYVGVLTPIGEILS